jgi:hypothetical protein
MKRRRAAALTAALALFLGTAVPSPAPAQSISITPTTLSLTEDVSKPGAGWTFYSTAQSWFPAGVSDGFAYTACVAVAVTTKSGHTSISAWVAYNPTSAPLVTYIAIAGAQTSCTTPTTTAVGPVSTNSASPTTVTSGLAAGKTYTLYYYVLLVPANGQAVSGSATVTITWSI